MTATAPPAAGFADPVVDAQQTFRACLSAMSRPGKPVAFSLRPPAIVPAQPEALAIVLALADFETTVWLDPAAAAVPEIQSYIRFHTGARIVEACDDADFALITHPLAMPRLGDFKQGVPDYPDRSATLIVQVAELDAAGWRFTGPGIEETVAFSARPLPDDFPQQWSANRDRFPCGVDMIFVCEGRIAGLPRSSRIDANGEGR